MLILMKKGATKGDIEHVIDQIKAKGFTPVSVPGPSRTAICVTGNKDAIESSYFNSLPGVKEVIRVTKPYKLVSREVKSDDTVIDLETVQIGGDAPTAFMAGPCSVESLETTLKIAEELSKLNVKIFRAGAFKPRTSPYSFQGHGEDGLKILAKVREETGMKIITEVIDTECVDIVAEHADILQVGTRNMYNYSLLKKLSYVDKPILLKRGFSATLEEWLNAAEYIMTGGNLQVILCERGVRTFSQHSRNTLDLNIVPKLREQTHLPIVVDPSHGIGKRNFIQPMSRASIAAGAQGLMIETHINPNEALSDAEQTISVETLASIMNDAQVLEKMIQNS